jgi:hypothetical protein
MLGKMSDTENYPLLHFREPFETVAWEVTAKGWYSGVVVELEDGDRYSVFFYDPVRLAQDLQVEAELGRPYLAEQGMIVIPEISETNMRLAIQQLHTEGWFSHLKPLMQ